MQNLTHSQPELEVRSCLFFQFFKRLNSVFLRKTVSAKRIKKNAFHSKPVENEWCAKFHAPRITPTFLHCLPMRDLKPKTPTTKKSIIGLKRRQDGSNPTFCAFDIWQIEISCVCKENGFLSPRPVWRLLWKLESYLVRSLEARDAGFNSLN